MAQLGRTYDTNELPQSVSFDPLPAGWYSVRIDETELKETNRGDGEYIKLKFVVTDPNYEGRIVFCNLNIRNPNEKAEQIGLQQLNSLIMAIGLSSISDTDELLNRNLMIKLKIKQGNDQYDASNEVKDFKALETGMPKVMGQEIGGPGQAVMTSQTEQRKPWQMG